MALVRNRATPEGRSLGKVLARMADVAEERSRAKWPDQQERCQSCAFRSDTLPNGCPDTVWDALKCVAEMRTFMCHQRFDSDGNAIDVCAGWFLAVSKDAPELPHEVKDYLQKHPYSDTIAEQEKAKSLEVTTPTQEA